MDDVQIIDTQTLKAAIDEGRARVVEVLMPKEYEKGHIPGAIHIHFGTIGGRARALFNKDDLIVTYCHNERCRAGRIAAAKLQALGYTRAYYYAGGKDGWTAAGYSLEVSSPDTEET
ncbi:MAG: rhodanese-like domain-containing protein [Spirochaeta sp.]|jgi:rhodanese-related sulfurtransferase|nr:rhodanese-like domain-containing protein [Spirochaeta sp.]